MIPKFRAWHKEYKVMRNVGEICGLAYNLPHKYVRVQFKGGGYYDDWPLDEIELMQWTGLQDKNGKDIYEGDILKIEDPDLEIEVGQVRFSDGGFWVDGVGTEYCNVCHVEIIGNIYEHSELLK